MSYSLGAMCASEAIGTCMVIYLGESIIANELLAKTKGQLMGWGFVALGFGFSFGVVIMMLGYISAHLNPATCLALWVVGKISFTTFLALSAAEFAGAFAGACLVWLHYLAHFKTVPEPAAKEGEDLLLRSRDALSPAALALASYNTRPEDVERRAEGLQPWMGIKDLQGFLRDSHVPPSKRASLVEVALGPHELVNGAHGLRRRSVQVCDVHRRLKDIAMEDFQDLLTQNSPAHAASLARSPSNPELATGAGLAGSGKEPGKAEGGRAQAGGIPPGPLPPALERKVDAAVERLDRLYQAAIVADQNAKLSIFATRPAIYSPFMNLLVEFMCTTMLVLGALLMYARRDLLYMPERDLFRATEGLAIGVLVFVAILGLGGPTGIAANPARDFSPRLAHWVLPIPGKGRSEFYYSWIPVLGPFLGGAASGGLYLLIEMLNHSEVPATVYPGP